MSPDSGEVPADRRSSPAPFKGEDAPAPLRVCFVKEVRGGAFTLIEILLAVALLGLLSAALVSGAAHLVGDHPQTPQEVFWTAVRTARRAALKSETEVQLSFDSKEKNFVVEGLSGKQTLPVPNAHDLTIDLLQGQSLGGSVLIRGQLVETQTIPTVSFYSDGTCMPFRVQFRTTGPAQILSIDPWTCSPMLESKNP